LAEEKKAEWLSQSGAVALVGTIDGVVVAYLHASSQPDSRQPDSRHTDSRQPDSREPDSRQPDSREAGSRQHWVWSIEMAFDPSHRSRQNVDAVLKHALSVGEPPAQVNVWAFAPWLDRLLSQDAEPVRQLLIMGRELPADAPLAVAGVKLAPFAVGEDEDAFLAVNNRAFSDHPENGGWDRSVLQERIDRSWFDAAGFLMAWDDDDLVGFCWTKRHDPLLGEIYVIATDPQRRRRGLGRFLLRSALEHLSQDGCERVMLYVRAGEEPAEALYRSEGFRLIEKRTEYRYLT
jgi:mycothiol synthase